MSLNTERKTKDSSPVSSPDESSMPSQSSAARYSLLNEKKDLANLNDRLACYIDRVRHLECENERLTREVSTAEETIITEVTSVKTIYENELSGTRNLLDEISREKAKLEIDAGRLVVENEELKGRLLEKSEECNSLKAKLSILENRLSELTNNYNLASKERMKLHDECKTLKEEKNKLSLMISNLQKNLDEEILTRVGLQNSLQTVREEIAFKEQVFQQQLTECRKKIEEKVNSEISQAYEEPLYESLQEVRDQYDIDLEKNRNEIKKMYEEKITSLEAQLMRYGNASSFAIEEMKQMQMKLDDANSRLAAVEEERSMAHQKARDLMREFEKLKSDHIKDIAKHNQEITQLKEELHLQVQKYEELMNVKVTLDREIATYGKLLEVEETRLNLSTSASNLSNRSVQHNAKRKRVDTNGVSSSSSLLMNTTTMKSDIEFSEINEAGKFIRLENHGEKEISLSGWKLIQTAATGECNNVSFKFNRFVKIKPGGTVTVWSSDTDQPHKPPENIVMKHDKWLVGDKLSTRLINYSGEEVTTTKHVMVPKTSTPIKDIDVHNEKCSLM